MNRDEGLRRLKKTDAEWDIIVIGGGATGVGVAVDAASRGHRVALLEQSDLGKGTSSRSTKLIHGGVRYLQQGNVPLVMEALKERGILRNNAPHLVHDLPFVVPNYKWWEAPFYGIGMRVYDVLAGKYGFGASRNLSLEETLERIPTIETDGLRGGVIYHDGQFDDARLLIDLAMTAVEQGATVVNYVRVTGLLKGEDGFVEGIEARDQETGADLTLHGSVVVNATGVFTDGVRLMDDPEARSIVRPSRGAHVVLDRSFLPGDSAVMVPHTDDDRVLFAIPWLDRVLVGTTDVPVDEPSLEPAPSDDEIDFILEHARRYLEKDPTRADVLSAFAGLRPLVAADDTGDTSEISREHAIRISDSGLLTIAGGKWTTYRSMAEDTVDLAQTLGDLEVRECVTRDLNIHGYHQHPERFAELAWYGSDAPRVRALIESRSDWGARIHERLPVRIGEIVWFAREEMARTVDDVLARRSRSLFIDARAALEAAPDVARVLAEEFGRDQDWQESQVADFGEIAANFIVT